MLLDSNIIIYAAKPEYSSLREFIAKQSPSVSALSYVEVLGYHKLAERERLYLEEFFRVARVIPISRSILEQAVKLKQLRKMTLGDSIIAATAITHSLILVTRNTEDFQWITELSLLNPIDID
jgi:predicted nucleic acid-binding protein